MTHTILKTSRPLVTSFTCSTCNKEIEHESTIGGTGYATDQQGNKHCYDCCAHQDRLYMRDNGKITLYLTHRAGERTGQISNWPGTLKIHCTVKQGNHNIAGKRYDCWFYFEGTSWHGVQYGDNTQLVHCKKVKQ